MSNRLLEVKDLRTCFYTTDGVVPAVDGISFDVYKKETVGMVGESGCGKSISCLSILRLIPSPPGKIVSGEILFNDQDLLTLPDNQMRKIRGNKISMIFQEPMTSLNPVLTIGKQLGETIELHQGLKKKEALEKSIEALRLVGISLPEKRVKEYPHQLSGGMRQRVMIAMSLVCNPSLLIADEPTTALDVTIQAQILELMKELKNSLGMAILLITHDLGVIAEMAERVIVMYAGKIIEEAGVKELFKNPKHPYTQGLLLAIPKINENIERLHVIEGVVPRPTDFPSGCRFHPRCEFKKDICTKIEPPLRGVDINRNVSCWLGTENFSREIVV